MGDSEPFPEQAERGSIHGNGGVRRLTFWRISAYSDSPPFLYPAPASRPACFTLICEEPLISRGVSLETLDGRASNKGMLYQRCKGLPAQTQGTLKGLAFDVMAIIGAG
ncbi:hypothetical protein [Halomonas sp. NCCP-2165]|nr:hypothetical protein [Halomonas sp. NCCP-2165]